MPLKVSRFVFNMFSENTYVVYDPSTLEAVVVDPGMVDEQEQQAIDGFIERNRLKVTQLVNTHMHLDHIFGNPHIMARYGVKTAASPEDAFLGETLSAQTGRYHIRGVADRVGVDVPLRDGDTLKVGAVELKVLAVPGHSPGGLALYDAEDGWVITGDSLFQGSVGRTDLPRGDMATLVDAIQRKLLTLPDDTVVLPGHGPETTIGNEKRYNQFLCFA